MNSENIFTSSDDFQRLDAEGLERFKDELADARGNADIDGYGDEGAGYDMLVFADGLFRSGWVYLGSGEGSRKSASSADDIDRMDDEEKAALTLILDNAISEADIDGYGDEGAGYDMLVFADGLFRSGWVYRGELALN